MTDGGITRKQAKQYPLTSKEYWETDERGVLVRKLTDRHKCDTPGRYQPRRREKRPYSDDYRYIEGDTYPRGSYWECTECGRVWRFGAVNGEWSWYLLQSHMFIRWAEYRKAQRSAPPKKSSVEED